MKNIEVISIRWRPVSLPCWHCYIKWSSFPGFQFPLTPFPPFYPTQLPATNGNDYLSSVSQIQSTFFHPLRHNHIPATTITTQITVVPSYSSLCLLFSLCNLHPKWAFKLHFIPQLENSWVHPHRPWVKSGHQGFVIRPLHVSLITYLPSLHPVLMLPKASANGHQGPLKQRKPLRPQS